MIIGGWQRLVLAIREFFAADWQTFGIGWNVGPASNRAAKTGAGQRHAMRMAGVLQMAVPARKSLFAIAHVGLADDFVDGVAHGNLFLAHATFAVGQLERKCGICF